METNEVTALAAALPAGPGRSGVAAEAVAALHAIGAHVCVPPCLNPAHDEIEDQ